MWDDVIIGEGDRGNTAVRCFKIPKNDSLSENQTSYWVSDLYLGLGMTVFKDTVEGRMITECIKQECTWDGIKQYLTLILIRSINPVILMKKVDNAVSQAFARGSEFKSQQIRQLLGMEASYGC